MAKVNSYKNRLKYQWVSDKILVLKEIFGGCEDG